MPGAQNLETIKIASLCDFHLGINLSKRHKAYLSEDSFFSDTS
ncbi:hypothetical protein X975_20153, partial [Stegodyphus mimosarum]